MSAVGLKVFVLMLFVRFEYLIPVSFDLVKPRLSHSQAIDGEMVKELYRQKTVYLAPERDIIESVF